MQNSSATKIESSSKNFSTSDSRNSTKIPHQMPINPNSDNLRMFTFMNFQQENKEQKFPVYFQSEKNEVNELSFDGGKLVKMIEQSRRRRQSFLSEIEPSYGRNHRSSLVNITDVSNLSNFRRSRTPKAIGCSKTPKMQRAKSNLRENLKLKMKQKSIPRFAIDTKNLSKSPYHVPQSCANRLFRAKSSLGEFKHSIKQPIGEGNISIRETKQSYFKRPEKEKQTLNSLEKLMKKKKRLEKELMSINTSLLVKKKVTKTGASKNTTRAQKKKLQ